VPAETFTAGVALDNDAPLPTPPSLPPDGAPPSGGSSTPGDGNGPDSTPGNPGDGLDSNNGGPVLADEYCRVIEPPCDNFIHVVWDLDQNMDRVPGTRREYSGGSLPPNFNINHKEITGICLDGEGTTNGPSQLGPCTPPSSPELFKNTIGSGAKVRATLRKYTDGALVNTWIHEEILTAGQTFSLPRGRVNGSYNVTNPPFDSPTNIAFTGTVGGITKAFFTDPAVITTTADGTYLRVPQGGSMSRWDVDGVMIDPNTSAESPLVYNV
jgi:hypothetical protein